MKPNAFTTPRLDINMTRKQNEYLLTAAPGCTHICMLEVLLRYSPFPPVSKQTRQLTAPMTTLLPQHTYVPYARSMEWILRPTWSFDEFGNYLRINTLVHSGDTTNSSIT